MVAAGGGLASPAKASSEQVENDDMGGFTSTDEATLSWATVSGGGQPSEESEATDAYPLAQKYVDIVSKRKAKQQRLMNGARGDDGGTRNVEENANEREASLVARQEGGERKRLFFWPNFLTRLIFLSKKKRERNRNFSSGLAF